MATSAVDVEEQQLLAKEVWEAPIIPPLADCIRRAGMLA